MDPEIRKVNGDNEIEGLKIGINGEYIDKVCGYSGYSGFYPLYLC